MVDNLLKDKAAIVGIGETEFSQNAGRSEEVLAVEASRKAIEDAGLKPDDIDGMVKYDLDVTRETVLASDLGIKNLRFFAEPWWGGAQACATIILAAMAVATGQATNVLCYRALCGRSGAWRFGQTAQIPADSDAAFCMPYGMMTPAQSFALIASRYLHKYNADPLYFAAVKSACSKHAVRNPRAMVKRVLTIGDYLASRVIAWPLRMFDLCLESDGGAACVVTSAERARDLKHPPVYIASAAQATGPRGAHWMMNLIRDDIVVTEPFYLADDLFSRAGMSREDIDVVQIYDAFAPMVLLVLEDLGFCKRGEAGPFVAEGNLDLGGKLPTNTSGGLLCEAYIHGMNLIVEGVRQMRGVSTSQVENAETCLVTSGVSMPTACMILRR